MLPCTLGRVPMQLHMCPWIVIECDTCPAPLPWATRCSHAAVLLTFRGTNEWCQGHAPDACSRGSRSPGARPHCLLRAGTCACCECWRAQRVGFRAAQAAQRYRGEVKRDSLAVIYLEQRNKGAHRCGCDYAGSIPCLAWQLLVGQRECRLPTRYEWHPPAHAKSQKVTSGGAMLAEMTTHFHGEESHATGCSLGAEGCHSPH